MRLGLFSVRVFVGFGSVGAVVALPVAAPFAEYVFDLGAEVLGFGVAKGFVDVFVDVGGFCCLVAFSFAFSWVVPL